MDFVSETKSDFGFDPGLPSMPMRDLIMIIFTTVFFALAFFYVKACHKLR